MRLLIIYSPFNKSHINYYEHNIFFCCFTLYFSDAKVCHWKNFLIIYKHFLTQHFFAIKKNFYKYCSSFREKSFRCENFKFKNFSLWKARWKQNLLVWMMHFKSSSTCGKSRTLLVSQRIYRLMKLWNFKVREIF